MGGDAGEHRAGTHGDVVTDSDRGEVGIADLEHLTAGGRLTSHRHVAIRRAEPRSEDAGRRKDVSATIGAVVVDYAAAPLEEHAAVRRAALAIERAEAAAGAAAAIAGLIAARVVIRVAEPEAASVGLAVPSDAEAIEVGVLVVDPAVAVVVDPVLRLIAEGRRGDLTDAVRRPRGVVTRDQAGLGAPVTLSAVLRCRRAAVAVTGLAGLAGSVVGHGAPGVGRGSGVGNSGIGFDARTSGRHRQTVELSTDAGVDGGDRRVVGAEPQVTRPIRRSLATGEGLRPERLAGPNRIPKTAPRARAARHPRGGISPARAAVRLVDAEAAGLVRACARIPGERSAPRDKLLIARAANEAREQETGLERTDQEVLHVFSFADVVER